MSTSVVLAVEIPLSPHPDSLVSMKPTAHSPATGSSEDEASEDDSFAEAAGAFPRHTPFIPTTTALYPPPVSRKAPRITVASVTSLTSALAVGGTGRASAFLVNPPHSSSTQLLRQSVNDAFEMEAANMEAQRKESEKLLSLPGIVNSPLMALSSVVIPLSETVVASAAGAGSGGDSTLLLLPMALTPIPPASDIVPTTTIYESSQAALLLPLTPTPIPTITLPTPPPPTATAQAPPPPRSGVKRPLSAFKAPRRISPVSAESAALSLATAAAERATRSRAAREADENYVPLVVSDAEDDDENIPAAVAPPLRLAPPPQQLTLAPRRPSSTLKPAKIVHSPVAMHYGD